MKTILKAVGLGYWPVVPSTSIGIRIDDMITIAITGPIAPPIILVSLVAAEDMPVKSLGVRAMIILISVTGKSAAPIPKRKSDAVTSA